ncbi:DUF4224 domain-containing protein [Scandinavium goeteborgense]|nr:DUF4224 domain-containing protein [Scandinavium goeteborgense]
MVLNSEILTTDAMRELTGYTRKGKQCEWLAHAGIWFRPDRNGSPRTTWFHVNNPLALRLAENREPENDTPNFDAVLNGRKTKKPNR